MKQSFIMQMRGTLVGADFLGISPFYAEQIFLHLEKDEASSRVSTVHIDIFFTPSAYEEIYETLEKAGVEYIEFRHHEFRVTVLCFENFPVTFFEGRPQVLIDAF